MPRRKSSATTLKVGGFKIDTRGVSSAVFIVVLACLILGILAGGFGLYAVTKNDGFEMIALADKIDYEIGGEGNPGTYEELGVKCVAFGKDANDSVQIKYLYREELTKETQEVDTIAEDVAGIYYVVYTSTNFKYKTVQLVRTVKVIRTEDWHGEKTS